MRDLVEVSPPEGSAPMASAYRNGPVTNSRPGHDVDGASMSLHPRQIKPYSRNPRRSKNPNYEQIKESIRVKGLLNALTVTRRPGDEDYTIYGGGNTRLDILQQFAELFPGNPLYVPITVIYRTWRTESEVIAAHLVENEVRGDITFWDRAMGLMSLKQELEAESGKMLSANEVRTKAAEQGWKLSRETLLLYVFATERLAAVGPWLSFSTAQALKDRIGPLSTAMTRLDVAGGARAFAACLSEVLAGQAAALRAAEEALALGAPKAMLDAATACNLLEERVARSIGISVPGLRQVLEISSSNPQISSAELRAEIKGVVTPASPHNNTSAPTQPTATTISGQQIPLPTPMLAAVKDATVAATAAPATSVLNAGLPDLRRQGALPPELASDNDSAGLESDGLAAECVLQTVQHLARSTFNADLLIEVPGMPLGYLIDLPDGELQPLPQAHAMPTAQQIRLRRAGWQLLATLSGQFDRRCCIESCMPSSSRWFQAVRSGAVDAALRRCGMAVTEDRIHVDAECLFYMLTEPHLLGPSVLRTLRSLSELRAARPNVLPPLLELVTTSSMADAS